MNKFHLYKRALHVYSEAQRVYDFQEACALMPLKACKRLGAIMDESHESCKDLYDCSCPELDALVGACRAAGAYGSRLTGTYLETNLLKNDKLCFSQVLAGVAVWSR